MARKKTITRDQILNAAYDIVSTEGFSRFTARNIASKMKCSTQPIYLEFKNMEELKIALYDKITDYLANVIYTQVRTGDILIDLALNYIHFALEQEVLFRAIYIENTTDSTIMLDFVYHHFMEAIKMDGKYEYLTEAEMMQLLTGTWITVTGLASLLNSGMMSATDAEIERFIPKVIDNIIEKKDYPNFILTKNRYGY